MTSAVTATIDLDALRHNFSVVKSHAPHSKVMAVIKANGYGHGMSHVANALSDADGFAVARVAEALHLRKAGIRKRILVLTGVQTSDELVHCQQAEIDVVIHSQHDLKMLQQTTLTSPISVWLKINTGMNRLGIRPSEVNDFANALAVIEHVRQPIKMMTHFACADDMSSEFTTQQVAVFETVVEQFEGEQSLANSAGILAFQFAHRHWVRPGIMLYGGNPFCEGSADLLQLKPVMTLTAPVISIHQVKKGESIGYGGTWIAPEARRIAIVGCGYGDGYPRHAKTGTPVLIAGRQFQTVGTVSMDSLAVDITDGPEIMQGDDVTLWGKGLPIDTIAMMCGTISYDLMCGVTPRVERKYIGGPYG